MEENVDVLRTMNAKLYKCAMAGNTDVLKEHIKVLERKNTEELKAKGSKHIPILLRELTPNRNTILHVAVQFGSVNNVKAVLEECPGLVQWLNKKHETALHIAARDGQADIVKELLLGAQELGDEDVKEMLTATNIDGDTALHMAARNCHLEEYKYLKVVELLVEADQKFQVQHPPNDVDETPLYLAAERGNKGVNVVLELLKNWESLDYSGPSGRTALHVAALKDFTGRSARELLELKEDLINQEDVRGWTPLQYAACSGNVPVMKVLLDHQPDCWEIVDKKGRNILHIAVNKNMKSMIICLLNEPWVGHLINQKNNEGNTPLHLLVASDYKVDELWKHHTADQYAFNREGMTPLDLVWSSFKKPGMPAFAAAYIEDKAFLGSEIDGGRLIADKAHDKLATFIRFKEEKAEKERERKEVEDERDKVKAEKDRVRREVKDEKDRVRREAKEEKDRVRREAKDEKDRVRWEAKVERDRKKDTRKAEKDKERRDAKDKKDVEKKAKDLARTEKQIEARKASTTVYNSLVIVAALIATMSSAAVFAIPGGYDGNPGRDQGMAVLARATAFKAFIITNTVALASSVTSILLCLNALYYYSISTKDVSAIQQSYKAAGVLILVAIFSQMFAFIAAAIAVLAHSIALVVSTCIIFFTAFIVFFLGTYLCRLYYWAKDKDNVGAGNPKDEESASAVPGTTNKKDSVENDLEIQCE